MPALTPHAKRRILVVLCCLLPACALLTDSEQPPPRPKPEAPPATAWTFKGELPVWKSFVANGTLFVVDSDYLYALDPTTGREKWRRENTNYELEKAMSADRLYKRDYRDGRIEWCAVSLETGEEIGRFPAQPSPNVFLDRLEATFGKTLVFIDRETGIHGVDGDTGRIKWTQSTKDTSTNFQAYDGMLYCSTVDGFLRAIDLETGRTVWKIPNEKDYTLTPSATTLYLTGLGDTVFGIDRLTGKRMWEFKPDSFHDKIVPFGDAAFTIVNHDTVVCLDSRTGQRKWQQAFPPGLEKIAPLGSVVYASDANGALYACHLESGEDLIAPATGFPVRRLQAAYGGLLYILGRDDRLYAVRAKARYTFGQEVQ